MARPLSPAIAPPSAGEARDDTELRLPAEPADSADDSRVYGIRDCPLPVEDVCDCAEGVGGGDAHTG